MADNIKKPGSCSCSVALYSIDDYAISGFVLLETTPTNYALVSETKHKIMG